MRARHFSETAGLLWGALAALLFAITGLILGALHRYSPEQSVVIDSFARLLINFSVLFLPILHRWFPDPNHGGSPWTRLRGHGGWELWAWGACGGITLLCFYGAIVRIGVTETSLLQGTQGIFIALLAPKLAGQNVSKLAWFGIAGSFVGLILLLEPTKLASQGESILTGRLLALGSGLSSGVAYVLLARIGKSAGALSISFYWCVAGFLVVALTSLLIPWRWPLNSTIWGIVFLAATAATLGQVLTTLAYRQANAAKVAAITYLTPLFAFAGEAIFFSRELAPLALLGGALIVAFGALMPFLGESSESSNSAQALQDNP